MRASNERYSSSPFADGVPKTCDAVTRYCAWRITSSASGQKFTYPARSSIGEAGGINVDAGIASVLENFPSP